MSQATIVSLHSVHDIERGTLCVVESGRDIPFEIKRAFYLYNLIEGGIRGQHAHRIQEQFIVCLSGRITLSAIGKNYEKHFTLSTPHEGAYFPSMTWVTVKVLSTPAVYVVFSSGLYEESDYIRNYAEFETLLGDM